MGKLKQAPQRLSRVQWLDGGLEALCEHGVDGLLTEALARRLGVTTGSFYWHFGGRDDFCTQLIEYWSERMTKQLIQHMEAEHIGPHQQLFESFVTIMDEDLARYETPIRAWALTNANAKRETAKVDRLRLDYISNLLRKLGFCGDQLEMRSRTLLLCAMAEQSFFLNDSRRQKKLWLKLRLELLELSR